MNYGTLPSRLLNAIDSLSNPRAQMFRAADGWQSISSEEFLRRVAGLSTAFVELGVKPGDRVGLFAANRPEWHTADFAITGAGGVTVPIYFNELPDRSSIPIARNLISYLTEAWNTARRRLFRARSGSEW